MSEETREQDPRGVIDSDTSTARRMLAQGRAAPAFELLQRTPSSDRGSEQNLLLMRAAVAIGDVNAARATAYALSNLDDAPREALLEVVEFFREDGDLDGRRTLLERMISERPDDHTVNIEMARWLADEGWNDKALERACHAAECAPGKKERAEAQSLLFSLSDPEGEAAFKELTREVFTGDPARVAAELSKTVAAHPELAEGWLFLGFVMRRLGRRRSAAQAFVRCAQLSDDANAHRELGALFGEFGRPRRAALHSKRALELLGGSDRVALLNFAAACCGDGQFEEAAGALARVGELYPDEPGIEVVAEAIALATRPARGFHGAGMGG